MKPTAKVLWLPLLTGLLTLLPGSSRANETVANSGGVPSEVAVPAPVITSAAPVVATKLPYGVEDVLKLSQANVGEDIILKYVQNSGTIYNLRPNDIVYLRNKGVSERVVNALLDQRKRVELASQAAAPAVPQQSAPVNDPATQAPAATSGSTPQAYTDPNATYVEAPLTPPASSVYVIPYSGAYSYYGPYGYYPYYSGWYGPSVSFGFRFGGGPRFYGGHAFGGHGFGGHGFSGHSFGGHGGHR
jgi:hypothetical protein